MFWPVKIIHYSFILLFFFLPIFFLTNTSELFEFNKIIFVYITTVVVTSAWITRCILEKRIIFNRSPLDKPILFFLLINLVSLFFSIDQRTSFFGYYSRFNGGLLSLISYSLLYWSFVSNLNSKSAHSSIKALLFGAFIVSIWAILEHFGRSFSCILTTGNFDVECWVQDVKNRVFATLGQPNWLAAYMAAIIFIPLSEIFSKFKKPLWNSILFLSFFASLIYTQSRSGYLAFAICSLLFGVYVLRRLKPHSVKLISISTILVVICLGIVFLSANPISLRFIPISWYIPISSSIEVAKPAGPALEVGGTESGSIRKIVWTGALNIWKDGTKNFLLGSGPETFAMAYYQHRPIEHNKTSEWELLYNKAHNEFINYLATTGLLGLLSYLLLLGVSTRVLLKPLLHKYQPNTDSKDSVTNYSLVAALAAGWVSISITNFWGFSVVVVQLFLFLFPALAQTLLSTPTPKSTPSTNLSGLQIISVLIVGSIAVWSLYLTAKYWVADVNYSQGLKSLRAFTITQDPVDILLSYEQLSQALQLNPNEPVINSEFSVVASYISILTQETNTTASAQLKEASQLAGQKAINISPYHPNYYKNLSRALTILATYDESLLVKADQVLEAASTISPTDPKIPLNRYTLANYRNDPEAARIFLEEVKRLRPELATATNSAQPSTSSAIPETQTPDQ